MTTIVRFPFEDRRAQHTDEERAAYLASWAVLPRVLRLLTTEWTMLADLKPWIEMLTDYHAWSLMESLYMIGLCDMLSVVEGDYVADEFGLRYHGATKQRYAFRLYPEDAA